MRRIFKFTLVRFVLAGGVNTMFGWSVYSTAILTGLKSWAALIISNLLGIIFNFLFLSAYAFRDFAFARLPLFIINYGVIYATNLACLHMIEPWIAQPIWAQLVLTPPIAILSYLLLSNFVFIHQSEEGTRYETLWRSLRASK